jgi:hypothetical protein
MDIVLAKFWVSDRSLDWDQLISLDFEAELHCKVVAHFLCLIAVGLALLHTEVCGKEDGAAEFDEDEVGAAKSLPRCRLVAGFFMPYSREDDSRCQS